LPAATLWVVEVRTPKAAASSGLAVRTVMKAVVFASIGIWLTLSCHKSPLIRLALARLDLDETVRLNRERNVEFVIRLRDR